jgi:ribosomal-protein-alanine N-acetyltransferase
MIKTFKSIDEQIEILKSKGLEIDDINYAKDVLLKVFEECTKRGIVFISLEVRESNVPAISLYQSLGFTIEGTRKNFYSNPRENAFVMIKNLD